MYIIALFIGLTLVVAGGTFDRNGMARISEQFAFTLFMIQNLAVMILTPAYLASAIAEEAERKTLDLLFATQLSNTEIILGKLTSRLIHLIGFVLAGFPILALIQFWGGIDMLLIAGNLVNTILNIISVGSFCLLVSTLCRTVTRAVMISYAVILPIGFCCLLSLRSFPFVLLDARSGMANQVTVQDLGILCVIHLVATVVFLTLAIASLRRDVPFGLGPLAPPTRFVPTTTPETALQEKPPRQRRHPEPADLFTVPYQLPPVTDHALLWKEFHVGGPPVILSRIVLVPMIPFIATGALVMVTWYITVRMSPWDEYRHAVEVWSYILRFFYYAFLSCCVLGVAFRATASVARERQQQTLEPLLLLPIDRSEILWAKLIGSVWRSWPWLALLLGDVVLGLILGAFHPFSAISLCVLPWAIISFFAG